MKLRMSKLAVLLSVYGCLAMNTPSALICAEENTAIIEEKESEEVTDPLTVSDEGYVIEGEGYYSVNAWCKEGDNDIFGRIYFPDDFDESKQYPTVVLVHGATLNADFWSKIYAPELAKAGYICYAFDERSGTKGGRGSYSTPTESGESTVFETVEDAGTALDFVKTKSYVNQEQIYLMGNSKGGLAVQALSSQRNDEIAGVIVLYGVSTEEKKDMVYCYEEMKENPYHNGEVLFIQGTGESVTLEQTLENMQWYEEGKFSFMLISDAYHGFGNQPDRAANIAIETVIDFLYRTTNGIGVLEE